MISLFPPIHPHSAWGNAQSALRKALRSEDIPDFRRSNLESAAQPVNRRDSLDGLIRGLPREFRSNQAWWSSQSDLGSFEFTRIVNGMVFFDSHSLEFSNDFDGEDYEFSFTTNKGDKIVMQRDTFAHLLRVELNPRSIESYDSLQAAQSIGDSHLAQGVLQTLIQSEQARAQFLTKQDQTYLSLNELINVGLVKVVDSSKPGGYTLTCFAEKGRYAIRISPSGVPYERGSIAKYFRDGASEPATRWTLKRANHPFDRIRKKIEHFENSGEFRDVNWSTRVSPFGSCELYRKPDGRFQRGSVYGYEACKAQNYVFYFNLEGGKRVRLDSDMFHSLLAIERGEELVAWNRTHLYDPGVYSRHPASDVCRLEKQGLIEVTNRTRADGFRLTPAARKGTYSVVIRT